jgi:hypothetical protein
MLDNAGDSAMTNGGNAWTASDVGGSAPVGQIEADFLGKTIAGFAPTSGDYLAKVKSSDPSYPTDSIEVQNLGSLAAGQLFLLLSALGSGAQSFPGGFYSVNGDLGISSSATVTNTGKPAKFTLNMGVTGAAAQTATAGFVYPQAETVTFPKAWGLNLGIEKDEIPYADINNPTAAGKKPIGTLQITSPVVGVLEENNSQTTATGQVYVVKNPSPKSLVPELELWIPGPTGDPAAAEVIGTLSGLRFPLTVTFQTPVLLGESSSGLPYSTPLAFSNLSVTFPAATSPYVIPSCSSTTAPAATATDGLAPFAQDFGDYSDGGTNGIYGNPTPVKIASTKTDITDDCTKLSTTGGSVSGVPSGKPKFGFTLADTQTFKSLDVTLPNGFSFKNFKASDLKTTATVKSDKAAGRRLTVDLSDTSSKVTVKLNGGISETKQARNDKSLKLTIAAGGASTTLKLH